MKSLFSDLLSLRGKVAVVTGGAGLLGPTFCRVLAEFGADIAVVDLIATAAKKVASDLRRRYGVRAEAVSCDVSSKASVGRMVRTVVSRLGAIHILHNNAASKSNDLAAFLAPFESYSLKTWRNIMSVNLEGMMLVAQEVGRQMLRQQTGGVIVQTGSIYGTLAPDPRIYEGSNFRRHPISSPAVYSASKAGVHALTQYLAAYWGPKKIRVNTLSPGGMATGQNTTFQRRYSQRIPLARMGKPDELAGALLYLASDASSYVTGQNVFVDGGLSAW